MGRRLSTPGRGEAPRGISRGAARGPLELSINAKAGRAFVGFLGRHIPAAHRMISRTRLVELSVALVGDLRMGELHARFMGIASPTDVLTFPLERDARGRATAGEVILCVPEARRRAREHGVPVERELLLYALHGVLHLSGFDDRTEADYRRMHRTEDRILTKLGMGPIFRAGEFVRLPRPSETPAPRSRLPRPAARRRFSP